MPVLQIHDLVPNSHAVVDPCAVIGLLGERGCRAAWAVAGVARYDEAILIVGNEAATRLEALAQSSERISSAQLGILLDAVGQVIWGEFAGYEPGRDTPWVVVRAIDSTWCEVETDDADVLDLIRGAFMDVRMMS